jgi:DsbC/DsbD-like thiol-disulfide interchange protein
MLRHIVSRHGRASVAVAALASAVALALTAAPPACAQGSTSASKVKATATASRPDAAGKQTVTVTLDIDKGWHLYANPVGNEDLAENKTVVTITGKAKPQSVTVEYPKGELIKDPLLKATYRVYVGRVAIRAVVQRAAGDTGPLQADIRLNACNDKACLPPGQITLNVQ